MALSRKPIWFFGSAWSSPAWLKTSNKLEGEGVLNGKPGGPLLQALGEVLCQVCAGVRASRRSHLGSDDTKRAYVGLLEGLSLANPGIHG
ncbi:uncharacterized protein LOC144126225 isoform X2 [Amblyomma americanum]